MKYFLDSVKKEDIDKYHSIISGVTSNPVLLEAAKMTNYDFLDMVKGYKFTKFVQITDSKEAHEISKIYDLDISDDIVFKITMHPKFYKVIQDLKSNGFKVAATTVYDIVQINQAIEIGANYTMVYRGKNEYSGLFDDAYKLKTLANSNINLVGASFRDKHQVKEAILSGMDYSTISTKVMDTIFNNSQLSSDIQQLYGKK